MEHSNGVGKLGSTTTAALLFCSVVARSVCSVLFTGDGGRWGCLWIGQMLVVIVTRGGNGPSFSWGWLFSM